MATSGSLVIDLFDMDWRQNADILCNRVWYLQNSDPVSAWKMFHCAMVSLNDTARNDDFAIVFGNKPGYAEVVQELEQQIRGVCIRYQRHVMIHLQSFMIIFSAVQALTLLSSSVNCRTNLSFLPRRHCQESLFQKEGSAFLQHCCVLFKYAKAH